MTDTNFWLFQFLNYYYITIKQYCLNLLFDSDIYTKIYLLNLLILTIIYQNRKLRRVT